MTDDPMELVKILGHTIPGTLEWRMARAIEALVKERDAALNWGEREHQLHEEYERGREAGIREAAEVVTEHYQTMCTEHRLLLVNRASAIISLIDQPQE